jgi:hypothetical protein
LSLFFCERRLPQQPPRLLAGSDGLRAADVEGGRVPEATGDLARGVADGAHALSFGVQIPVGDPAGEVSGGLWYSAAFDIGRTQSVASRE